MYQLQILWQLVLADFRERTRRYSYLITLMAALFIGYLVLTGKYSYHFGTFIPLYNSAWVGTTVAMAGAVLFSFMGFYIVRTSISRDRVTRVGEILLTTRLSGRSYLLAKFASNLLVFCSMVGALALTALVAMLARIPLAEVSLTAFLTPFIVFPVVIGFTVAAAAVLFDTVRWLRGVVGNICISCSPSYAHCRSAACPVCRCRRNRTNGNSVQAAIDGVYPGAVVPMSMGFVDLRKEWLLRWLAVTFVWNGIDWSQSLLLSRLIWPGIALAMLVAAMLLFDRFEQSGKKFKAKRKANRSADEIVIAERAPTRPAIAYKSMPEVILSNSVWPLVRAELRLSLRDLKPLWLLMGVGLLVGELVVPFDVARKFLVPGAMIWPLVVWSAIGARQTLFDMKPLMFCSVGVHSRQFVAMLLTGIVVAIGMCSPMIVRSALTGEFAYLILLLSSALLIPTTALALGVVSGSRKFFEVVYPMIWYAGSIDGLTPIDLLGTTPDSTGPTRVAVFVLIALGSTALAWVARRRSV